MSYDLNVVSLAEMISQQLTTGEKRVFHCDFKTD